MSYTSADFVEWLSGIELVGCFNPYRNSCEKFDVGASTQIRRGNLMAALDACISAPIVDVWVGRDLGHRGGRRTGLALTDEAHLATYAGHLGLGQLSRSTVGPVVREVTASCIFQFIETSDVRILTWNAFPFHPYEDGDHFTNRAHTRREARVGEEILDELIRMVRIRRLIAIGNDAFKATIKYPSTIEKFKIRHPSYGGKPEFMKSMTTLYGAPRSRYDQLTLPMN